MIFDSDDRLLFICLLIVGDNVLVASLLRRDIVLPFLFVRPSVQCRIVSERMRISSSVLDDPPGHHSSFFLSPTVTKFKDNSLAGYYTEVGNICDSQPKLPFISETLRDRRTVTMDH